VGDVDGDAAAPVDAPLARALPGSALQGTAFGERLEPGERVIFFVAPSHTATKVTCVLFGVLLAPMIFGIALVAYGLLYDRWALRFVLLTDRRLLAKKGDRPTRSIALADVVSLRVRRPGGARLLEPASHAAGESREAQKASAYWTTADLLVVQGKRGSLAIERCADLAGLGPVLARAAFEEGWVDRVPTANAPP
jgi:hypothetical protein